jgi:hypothetical protein
MSKEKAKQDLKEAVELFWSEIEAYKKGGHYHVWNNGLNLLQNQVKRFGAAIKADLGKKKYQQVIQENPVPLPAEPRHLPENEIEDKVVLADNGETTKAKKEATKKRKTRSRKKKES